MPDYVNSSETRVLLDGNRLEGVQSYSLDIPYSAQKIISNGDKAAVSFPIGTDPAQFQFSWDVSNKSWQQDVLFSGGALNNNKKTVVISDLDGSKNISGYLSSYSFSAAVGQKATCDATLVCDSVSYATGNPTTNQNHTNDSYEVGIASNVFITATDIYSGFNLQDFSFSYSVNRVPVAQVGERFPRIRAVKGAEGQLQFSSLRSDYFALQNTGNFAAPQNFTGVIKDSGGHVFYRAEISGAVLEGVKESCDLDGNETLSFSFSFSPSSLSVERDDFLLSQSGSFILQQNGSRIIL